SDQIRLPKCSATVAPPASLRQHAHRVVIERRRLKLATIFSWRMLPMSKPRISYIDPSTIKDPAMIAEFERCAREGTPRPESQAIRAHVPATFWSFATPRRDGFNDVL